MTDPVPDAAHCLRVLYINPLGALGGAERSLLDFLASAHAIEPGFKSHLVLFADGPLASEARRLGATVRVLPLPQRLHTLGDSGLLVDGRWLHGASLLWALTRATPALQGFIVKLRSEIVSYRPHIVHTNGMKAHLLSGLATPSGVPLIWHMHDFLSQRPFASRLLKLTSRRARTAIAISDAVAVDTRRVLPSVPVTTILNAIDLEEFSPGSARGLALDALSGMSSAPTGTLRIGLIATYARWKGQDVFLRAAARVRAAMPDDALRFYIVGGPIYATGASQFSSEELNRLIAKLNLQDAAALIPFQSSLLEVYRSLDIVVHSSTRPEPFGRSIVEAMACARPTVVSAAGGAKELVQPEITGLIHSPGDVRGLADAIARLVRSPELRARLGKAARETACKDFARSRLGPILIGLYKSFLGVG